MSFEALTWANRQRVGSPTQKLVLLLLANISDQSGKSFPSHKYLAAHSELNERTVVRCLDDLQKKGLLKITPRFKDSRQTTNLYELSYRGGTGSPTGVAESTPQYTKVNTQIHAKEIYTKEFQEFWEYYPRKTGKFPASKKYQKLITDKVIKPDQILKAVRNYNEYTKHTEKKFIPYCETWLNKRYFEEYIDKKIVTNTLNSLAG